MVVEQVVDPSEVDLVVVGQEVDLLETDLQEVGLVEPVQFD